MRSSPFWLIVIALMLVLDFYVFQAIKVVSQNAGAKARFIIYSTYWTLSILALLTFLIMPFLNLENFSKGLRSVVFTIVAGLFFAKFTVAVFLLVDDLRRGVRWIAAKLLFSNTEG